MTRALALSAVALTLSAYSPSSAPQATVARRPVVTTLASYPHGAFLENLAVDPDGSIMFTSYFSKSLMVLRPEAAAAPLAALPAHPVGVLRTKSGFLVTAHGIPFTDAPAFFSSNKILVLASDGAVRRTIEAPDARFLNGLVALADDKVLIADSGAGLIWAFTPSTGALRVWLRHPLLTADPEAKEFRPAANGLKLHAGRLYVSNSSRGSIQRIALTPDGEADGPPVAFVAPGPVDDFAFAADGAIYAATHGDRLLRIEQDGSTSIVLETGCDACTSVAVSGSASNPFLIVLTTGRLLEGGTESARVLRVSLR